MTPRTEIECAIARGWDDTQIMRRLGVTAAAVKAAWTHLEDMHAHPDVTLPKPSRDEVEATRTPAPTEVVHEIVAALYPQTRPQFSPQIGLHTPPAPVDPLTDRIVRDELASIYSRTVPEHHGQAVPLPPVVTEWERVRLSQAARNLTVTNEQETA